MKQILKCSLFAVLFASCSPSYKLPAEYVIHTPGPIYEDGRHGEPELLASCYRNSLIIAADFHCETIAFPCISAGIYGYPMEEAAVIALSTVHTYLTETKAKMTVYHVCFNKQTEELYRTVLSNIIIKQSDSRQSKNSRRILTR